MTTPLEMQRLEVQRRISYYESLSTYELMLWRRVWFAALRFERSEALRDKWADRVVGIDEALRRRGLGATA